MCVRCLLGDIREKLRLAFDMYDMNKNGKVISIRRIPEKNIFDLINATYTCF